VLNNLGDSFELHIASDDDNHHHHHHLETWTFEGSMRVGANGTLVVKCAFAMRAACATDCLDLESGHGAEMDGIV
jgi:hypothetical protein